MSTFRGFERRMLAVIEQHKVDELRGYWTRKVQANVAEQKDDFDAAVCAEKVNIKTFKKVCAQIEDLLEGKKGIAKLKHKYEALKSRCVFQMKKVSLDKKRSQKLFIEFSKEHILKDEVQKMQDFEKSVSKFVSKFEKKNADFRNYVREMEQLRSELIEILSDN